MFLLGGEFLAGKVDFSLGIFVGSSWESWGKTPVGKF
jgi:hypothetical protein